MSICLGMYDPPEAHEHVDRLWQALATAAREAGFAGLPEQPDREHWHEHLLAPDLVLGQTCGYPLTHALAGRVRYVATPCYAAPGCAGSFYRSAFVVRTDNPAQTLADTRGGVYAYNASHSHSGWNAPRLTLAGVANGAPMFSALLESGGHAESLAAVAARRADLCATDGVTFALLRRHRPAAVADLRVLAWTPPAPGLPYVTRVDASDAQVQVLRSLLRRTLADPALATSTGALLLTGIEVLPVSIYQRILDMENEAVALGYADIA